MRLHPARDRASFALVGLLALAGSACGAGGKAAGHSASKAKATTTTVTAVEKGTVGTPVIAPLTGLPDEGGKSASRPALAMKIDNAPEARPQAGLDRADVVYEEVVEGGVTRFIAVFQSGAPDQVGPLRSVRPMDPNIIGTMRALVAYSGGIPEFIALLHKAPIQDVSFDNATSAYHRDHSRNMPHDLFAAPGELWAKANPKHSAPPPALFEFRSAADTAPFGDTPAASVRIPYSQRASASYLWDAPSDTWKRTENGSPHVTASGAQIAPTNLVVQFVGTRDLRYKDRSGTAVTESIVIGSGDAWFFSGGRMVKGHWSKPDASAVTAYTDAAGAPVKLAPGRTWVHLAPLGTPVAVG